MKTRSGFTSIFMALLLVLIGALPACGGSSAGPKEPYKIGVMAAMTGPLANTSGPFTQGFISYLTRLNEEGGVDGRQVQLMVEDDRGEAATAVANVKKLTDQGAILIYNTSLSATFPPTIAEVRRVKIPALFAVVAPDEALPPTPDPLIFGLGSRYATPTTTVEAFIAKTIAEQQGTKQIKLGVLGTELPISKKNVDNIVGTNTRFGIETMGKVIPVNTADVSPVALAFKDWGANWIHGAAPGPFNGMLYDTFKKMGYEVNFLDMVYIEPFEPTMQKYKGDSHFYEVSMVVPFTYNLLEHQEILDALKKQKITEYHSGIISGWLDGKLVAETLKKTSWPVTTDKLLNVMNNTNLNLAPLMGPAVWTSTDHVGPSYWRVYHWEGDKIVPVGPWIVTDVMGKEIKTVEKLPGTK